MSWTPKFSLDLHTASSNAFTTLLEDFDAWRSTEPQRNIDLSNGWKKITPETAEAMLPRNPYLGGNRRPTLPTVKYYARQMAGGAWKATGQPVIFDTDGTLLDAGHRLWACYLSGASFPTYLIGDVPHRSDAVRVYRQLQGALGCDASATAGLNGLAKQMATVVSMAMHFDQGLYSASTKRTLDKVSPIEVVEYVQQHDNLRLATRLMAGEYRPAANVIDHKNVGSFVAYKIIDLHGEDVLDTFMTELGHVDADPEEGSPVAALQKVLANLSVTATQPSLRSLTTTKDMSWWCNLFRRSRITLRS